MARQKAKAHAVETPDREALTWLLAGGTVALVPHLPELPIGVIATFYVAAGWRWATAFRRWPPVPRMLRIAFVMVAVLAVRNHFGHLFGPEPGLALLVALLGLKFLELQTLRDYVVTTVLYFVVIATSFLTSQSLLHGAYALFAVWVQIAVLSRVQQSTGITAVGHARLALTLVAQAIPLMLVMYFLFPRVSGVLLVMPSDTHGTRTGMPEVVEPGGINALTLSPEVAFRATVDPVPPPAQRYWRGRVLWRSNGRAWDAGPTLDKVDVLVPEGERIRYQITLEPSDQAWLYALDLPLGPPAGAKLINGHTLARDRPVNGRLTYEAVSAPRYHTGPLSARERVIALALPPISARVRALANRWHADTRSDADIVRAALDFFHRENFYYTLTPPLLGSDPVDEFLFDSRRGFCEHYATAFATLMRAAGVPSRLVIGYQGGDWNPAGNYFIVRQADAHAWTEVWLPARGWVRVDPTAAVAPERIEFGIDAMRRLQEEGATFGRLAPEALIRVMRLPWIERAWRNARHIQDYANLSWYRWVTSYDAIRQQDLLERLGIADIAIAIMVTIVALLLGIYAVVTTRLRAQRNPIVAVYRVFCHKLAQTGLVRAPHEGPQAFAERVTTRRPDLRDRVDVITRLYVQLRYGAAPPASGLRALKRAVRRLRVTRTSLPDAKT